MTLRNALVSLGMFGWMISTGFAQPTIKNVPAARTAPVSGREMFNAYCAVCHGPSGRGDGPAASALKKVPSDLSHLTVKNGGKFPENQIADYISGAEATAAHGSREMPIWGQVFDSMKSDKSVTTLRVRNLTDYVKSLQSK